MKKRKLAHIHVCISLRRYCAKKQKRTFWRLIRKKTKIESSSFKLCEFLPRIVVPPLSLPCFLAPVVFYLFFSVLFFLLFLFFYFFLFLFLFFFLFFFFLVFSFSCSFDSDSRPFKQISVTRWKSFRWNSITPWQWFQSVDLLSANTNKKIWLLDLELDRSLISFQPLVVPDTPLRTSVTR